MSLNLNEIKAKQNATANGSTAGQGFTPTAKGDRPQQGISKAELCKQIGVSIAEFETHCKQWSIVVDDVYTPSQAAAMIERFGVKAQPRPAANNGAIATQTQQVVGVIRETAHSQRQRLDALTQQVDLTAEVVADQYAELLDPRNIEARIAAKVVDRLGKLPDPTPLEELDLSEIFDALTIPKFSLPQSFGRSPQLVGVSGSSTNSNSDTNAA